MAGFEKQPELRKLNRILKKINRLADDMHGRSDAELQAKTAYFREQLTAGKSLDEILPEAYAVVREAAKRVLGMYPFDVQVLCAIALHQGRIAEMKTGEGKTLVAAMPLYLNALSGESTILITMNGYLAQRDGRQMGKLFSFLGLTTAVGVPDEGQADFTTEEKRKIYAADIVYTTNGTLGFDYLNHHLASDRSGQFLRPFSYVIIDEADAVLLDSAQTPLVISGVPRVQSNLYDAADLFVQSLEEKDYETGQRKVYLTESGIRKAEEFFSIGNLYAAENFAYVRHVSLALRAHFLMEAGEDYVVEDHRVKLLDAKTGRIVDHTKLRAGQHQAIEAKEHTPLTPDSMAMASITFQSFFQLFPKIAGMSGTVVTDAEEFRKVYGLRCVKIPTRLPMIRIDQKDRYYYSEESQVEAAVQETIRLHQIGRPVLLIVSSIEMGTICSARLVKAGVPHNLLDARSVPKEAAIIKEAGIRGAVTVATSVAGRGTDIRLGEGVAELGGLAVIGVGRMANRRQELQARGRSGRQGDPGSSCFYLSLEDAVVKDYGSERLEKYREHSGILKKGSLIRAINRAQRSSESQAEEARRMTMQLDESVRVQRNLIYEMREHVIAGDELRREDCLQLIREVIERETLDDQESCSRNRAIRFLADNISRQNYSGEVPENFQSREEMCEYLYHAAEHAFARKLELLHTEKQVQVFLRRMTLCAIDEHWVDEVDFLQQLRMSVSGRRTAQRNVVYEYHKEAYRAWKQMVSATQRSIMRNILLGEIMFGEEERIQVMLP